MSAIQINTSRDGALTRIEISCAIPALYAEIANGLTSATSRASSTFDGSAVIRCNKTEAGRIAEFVRRANYRLAPRQPAASQPTQSTTRIAVSTEETAPETLNGKKFTGYGKVFRGTDSWHENYGCSRPDLVDRLIRYAYYA